MEYSTKAVMTMKTVLAPFLALVFAVTSWAGSIKPPKGFNKKLYDASYALYATSVARGFTEPKFSCTVTAYQHFQDGYLLIGAGHCTTANPDLPADMKFFVEPDISRPPIPVTLLKAVLLHEDFAPSQVDVQPIDYAIYYLKTTAKLPTVDLGDESSLRVGSKTTNVNFSLGLAKYMAPGFVSSTLARHGESSGFFGVQMFMSHGASGSSVVDVKTRKIVGLVIAGEDGATLPAWIEPISVIEAQLKTLNIPDLIAHPVLSSPVVVITPEDFAASFGPTHPFMLTVHGPNPVFTQAEYSFRVETDGFELSDEYYYDIPVFIDKGAEGYRLVSTKDGLSVTVTPLRHDVPSVDDMVSLLAARHSGNGSSRNIGNRVTPPANHNDRPDHSHEGSRGEGRDHDRGRHSDDRRPRGRDIDRDTREHYFGREHCFRPEFYYSGGYYSFVYAGIWFDFENAWPYPVDDVFIDVGPDGLYYMSSPAHPGFVVQVWIP
jgi:Trypsin-like peptidase domain